MSEERRQTRVCSSIDRLPSEVKLELDGMLLNNANSYMDIVEWLNEQGYEISHSAVGRYALRSNRAAQRVAETIQRTQAIAAAVENYPGLDYSKAASMVLMDGLMRKVSTADEEFLELPLDKAGRLIASLSRNATYEQRVRQDMKKKAELAFEQMEAELMSTIKQDKALADALRDILARAREKVLSDEGT